MTRPIFTVLGVTLALALCASVASAHGGTYQGPQGGGTPGYSGPAGGTTPSPNPGPGPTAGGGGTTPTTPGGTTPQPGGGTGPTRPGARPASAGKGAGAAARGGRTGATKKSNYAARFYEWDWWWDLNEERFLNLKNKVRSAAKASDNADVFLGEETEGDNIAEVTTKQIRNEILPILMKAVKDPFFDARSGALIALGKVGDSTMLDLVDKIKAALADDNKQVRESSCLALGVLGSKDSVDLLFDIVNNTKDAKKTLGRGNSDITNRTRAFAAVAIGLIGSSTELADEGKVIDSLLKLASAKIEGDRDTSVGPALALGLIQSEKGIPGMLQIFNDPDMDEYVRAHIGIALGKVGARSAIPSLLKGLKDRRQHVRRSSAIALGLLTSPDDKKTVKELRQYAKGAPDRATRNFCIMALGEIASDQAKSTLIQLAKKGKALHDRTFGALALGVAGFNKDDETKGEIGRMLEARYQASKAATEKGALAISIGLLGYTPAQKILRKELEGPGAPELKGFVCTALGLMNDRDAIPLIQKLVKQRGGVEDLRKRAAIALGLLKDPEAVGTLKEVIETNTSNKAVLAAATVALGYVGDRRAIPVLATMLAKDQSGVYTAKDMTRAFATVALGFLGDKAPLPILSKVQENSNYLAQTSALAELLSIL